MKRRRFKIWAKLEIKFGKKRGSVAEYETEGRNKNIIFLDPKLENNKKELLKSLIHELTHFALEMTGLSKVLEGKEEEELCKEIEVLVGKYMKKHENLY